MNDTISGPIVHLKQFGNKKVFEMKLSHLDDVTARGFAPDGNEGPGEVLGDGDLLPSPGHHGVGSRGEGGGEDEPRGHVTEESGLQGGGTGQQLLQDGWGQQVEGSVGGGEDSDGVRAGEPLHQAGGPDGGDEAGEGGVDGQGVEDGAGEAAGAGRDLELEAGRRGGARR